MGKKTVLKAIKLRLRPTEQQKEALWKSAGTARWAYNWALSKQIESYKTGRGFISDGLLRKELTTLKKTSEYEWLYEVSNNVTKQAIKDLCVAYKRFFKGVSNTPKYKSRKKSQPSFYNDGGVLKADRHQVLLEKVGWVKTSEQLPMNVKYFNPRVSFDGKYWYLSVAIEVEMLNNELTTEILGIDVGIEKLMVCSNGSTFRNINKSERIKKLERQLRRKQRSLNRKFIMNKKGDAYFKTKNIDKLQREVRILYRRITNIRNNHIYQAVNTIVKTKPSVIVMEDLNIAAMMKNKYLSRLIQQQKFYMVARVMEYKCDWLGIDFIKADRYFPSSKTCSKCGWVNNTLHLSDRVFHCNCGLSIDRDLNASINLRNYAMNQQKT